MKQLLFLYFLMFLFTSSVRAQEVINLYPAEIPNSKTERNSSVGIEESNGMFRKVVDPTLEIYLPEKGKAGGSAVVICPGGGYSVVVYRGEGVATAKTLAQHGIAAFVLKYRLPNDSLQPNKKIAPLQDAQQAMKIVRENAEKWKIKPDKIGIMGFSAGGHLAATEATHYKEALIDNPNNTSLRPDFQVLVYPVISMQDGLTHRGSRNQLLGNKPSQEEIDFFSCELQVPDNAPPAYLTHAGDDQLVDVDNSILYFEKLRHLEISAELHIYQEGGHGFIFRHPQWIDPLLNWMKESNLIKQ